MDNITHSLVGLATAKAGLERLSPCATAVCIIGANLPDADIVARFWGGWFYLEHHRGITHSIVGTLALAFLLPLIFYFSEKIYGWLRNREPKIRLANLTLASLIATATHPLFDWTNNYGVRPLLPWSGRWFYGDLVFIIDPYLWLSIGGAAFLLTAHSARRVGAWAAMASVITILLFWLPERAGFEYPFASRLLWVLGLCGLIAAHRLNFAARWRSSIAIGALALVIVYWAALSIAHRKAYVRAEERMQSVAMNNAERLQSLAATPVLADPSRWMCLAETDKATYRFDVRLGADLPPVGGRRFAKPQGAAAESVRAASEDERTRVFMDFARFPVVQVERDCASRVLVQFADLRFMEPGQSERGGFGLNVTLENGFPDSNP